MELFHSDSIGPGQLASDPELSCWPPPPPPTPAPNHGHSASLPHLLPSLLPTHTRLLPSLFPTHTLIILELNQITSVRRDRNWQLCVLLDLSGCRSMTVYQEFIPNFSVCNNCLNVPSPLSCPHTRLTGTSLPHHPPLRPPLMSPLPNCPLGDGFLTRDPF